MITKNNEKIAALEPDNDNKEDNSMKALGLFNSIRGVFQAIMTYVGGIVVQKTADSHLRVSGMILAAYPILFCIQTMLFFKEEKVISVFKFS